MKKLVIFALIAGILLAAQQANAESVTNGGITMFSVGNEMLGLLIHAEKKILTYYVTRRTCALIGVRTWHYDAQFASTVKTYKGDGCFPRASSVDAKASPLKLGMWLRENWRIKWSAGHKVPGMGASKGGGTGELSLVLEESANSGLLVILDSENSGFVIYEIDRQKINFAMARSILVDAQVPMYYPANTPKPPTEVRVALKKMEKELKLDRKEKAAGAVPFEMKELKFLENPPEE